MTGVDSPQLCCFIVSDVGGQMQGKEHIPSLIYTLNSLSLNV